MRFSPINKLPLLLIFFLLMVFMLGMDTQPASTAQLAQESQPTENPLSISNAVCLSCHEISGQSMQIENGEILDLTVWPDEFASSIHGELGYACVQCHRTVGNYPHPPATAASLREFTITMNNTCGYCHEPQVILTQDSVHAEAFNAGERQAPVCTDCHGSHNVQKWREPNRGELTPSARLRIPQVCANCHNAIYEKYTESVHGAALYNQDNSDVPTCIDCHGVHNIETPTTNAFRLYSTQTCAKCHTDPTMMAKYGLSTEVLSTYVDDFHGTTVSVFQKQSPDAPTNKPVCYDCHGVHDIRRINDPELGLHMQGNLLVRCKICHPEATTNFPTAWLSHYIPSPESNPLVYYVNLFYKFFIPGVLGPMVILVGLDVGHTVVKKYRKKYPRSMRKKPPIAEPESTQPMPSTPIPDSVPPITPEPIEPPPAPETTTEAPPASEMVDPTEKPPITTEPDTPSPTPETPPEPAVAPPSSDPASSFVPDQDNKSDEEVSHE